MKIQLTILVLSLFLLLDSPPDRISLVSKTLNGSSSIGVINKPSRPNLENLELVTRLPQELPQRVMGLAYDGEKLWATIYLGQGAYAIYYPSTQSWQVSEEGERQRAIRDVAGAFQSPGALCFVNGRLWIAGAYGESFGAIDLHTWKIERVFKGKQREVPNSQFYSSMAFDGNYLWIAWHLFKYGVPTSETQLLLKVDPDSGKIVTRFPLPPGTANDGTHGLTWDGSQLWHVKDQRLTAINPTDGSVTLAYKLKGLRRPSGLAWDGKALWISEFEGRIWRLPFQS